MKNILSVLNVSAILLFLLTSYMQSPVDNASLGDVKYSVLPPDIFKNTNPGWVPLNGQSTEADWKILELTTFKDGKLPDARGRFIRVMNLGQIPSEGDSKTDRAVGEYQVDLVGDHVHNSNAAPPSGWRRDGAVWTSSKSDGMVNNTETAITSPCCGSETRPKNITLYIYIKVK